MTDCSRSGSPGSAGEFGWGGAAGAHLLIAPETLGCVIWDDVWKISVKYEILQRHTQL